MDHRRRALVVMYHYVRDSRESFPPGSRPLLTRDFERQLDWLEQNYEVVSAEAFLWAINNGLEHRGKPLCLLTFDDGTKDHLEIVAPILRRRSLPGLFFVLTWPSERLRMPVTHALHWALGQPKEQVWATLRNLAETRLGGIHALGSIDDALRIYHYEPRVRARVKYAMNFALSSEVAEGVIEEIAAATGQSLTQLVSRWFLNEQEIKQLYSFGMEIGMHGSSHRSVDQLGATGMQEEILHSSSYLTQLLGDPPVWFCSPFGRRGGRQQAAAIHRACRDVGVEAIITEKKALVNPDTSSYEIPRYDCIYLPPKSDELLAD